MTETSLFKNEYTVIATNYCYMLWVLPWTQAYFWGSNLNVSQGPISIQHIVGGPALSMPLWIAIFFGSLNRGTLRMNSNLGIPIYQHSESKNV